MKLDYEESYKGFKVPVLYHDDNGKSLKGMGNGLGVGKLMVGEVTVLIQGRNGSDLTKIVAMEMEQVD